jgi:hypothetical protein
VFVGAEGYLPTDNFSPRQTTEMDLFERGDNMIAVTCITVGKYVHVESPPYDIEFNKCSLEV